ncbi:MAG: ATP-dependent Clp protease ATP-binding subunit [Bacteroidales bacterium]|jgi:ATP-dependent Clp protease ATP-binding subunit ClpC|nr:ATP-dependent Clp protease ATP-binding subunit [Bacteroidales bacterium]
MTPQFEMTPQLSAGFKYAPEEARRLQNNYVGVEHLLLALFRIENNPAIDALVELNADVKQIKQDIERNIRSKDIVTTGYGLPENDQLYRMKRLMCLESQALKNPVVAPEHAIMAILKDAETTATGIMNTYNITYDIYRRKFTQATSASQTPQNVFEDNDLLDSDEDAPNEKQSFTTSKKNDKNSQTPALDKYGHDLTKSALDGLLDPIVGREEELNRIAQILSRRKKNNPVLIGEPGVGKSAIAEGLATKIVERNVPRVLLGKRVITLDIAGIVAGTKYRGQFEERIKAILDELKKHPEIIIFIDEIHTIVGAGNSSGALDAANMFKPALARGEIQCIGATTLDEYRENIEIDSALERRFQKIIINPTTVEETIAILNNIKSKYEAHHHVIYTSEVIRACVVYTDRYITDRFLPDKAIDALDESGAKVHTHYVKIPQNIIDIENALRDERKRKTIAVDSAKYEDASKSRDKIAHLEEQFETERKKWNGEMDSEVVTVTDDDVREVVAKMSGVPIQRVAKDEMEKLRSMQDDLQKLVIGQNEAIAKVVRAIRRNKTGLKDPNRPIGSFVFLGPTGVGKTYLTKILAKYMFDSEQSLIRIDMSEYMEKFALSRLIGAPPGYVGYEEGGQLTEKVRRKPYSIILLDELEKAHPDILNLLLQVLDEGQLTDGTGRKVDFKNTIIIMTSNIGSRQIKEFGQGVGFQTAAKEANKSKFAEEVIEKELRKKFAPEFLNRIDEIIVFQNLEREDIFKIIDIELTHLRNRIKDMDMDFAVTDEAKDFIIEKGWDPQYGARPLKRAIQRYVEDLIAEEIMNDALKGAEKVTVDKDGDALVVRSVGQQQ